jgi:predicted HicB family RNase H-like nuclease
MMEYKGYVGVTECDEESAIIHGEVINTRDVVTFQGESIAEVKKAFHESVDDYLAFCKARGEDPDKPFSGQFVTRVSPSLHRQASLAAAISGKSLNAWVIEQIHGAVARIGPMKTETVKKSSASGPKRACRKPARRRGKKSEQHA